MNGRLVNRPYEDGGRFVMESWYDCHRQSLGFQIRCALQHAPTGGMEAGMGAEVGAATCRPHFSPPQVIIAALGISAVG